MRTSELTGRALDWAVAYALLDGDVPSGFAAYSFDWSFGGPIIERENIQLKHDGQSLVRVACGGSYPNFVRCSGPTPLIAAMRCYVASKLGDEVDVPNELIEPAPASDDTYDEWGVNTKNSFNTPPRTNQ